MLALVITLSVFLFLFLVVVGLIIARLLKDNSDLEKHNKDLQKRLDDLIKKPSMVGLSYKSDKKDVQAIMNSMKEVMVQLQKASCTIAKKDVDRHRKEFIDSIRKELAETSPPVKCANVRTMYSKEIDQLAGFFLSDVPKENAAAVKVSLNNLIGSILDAQCTNDSVDVPKVDQLVKDVFDAICTNI